jgi:hypothetical protein
MIVNRTNYPLVRITNKKTNHVSFCCTFNYPTLDSSGNTLPLIGVPRGMYNLITTSAAFPAEIPTGGSSLVVIANGIRSKEVSCQYGRCPIRRLTIQLNKIMPHAPPLGHDRSERQRSCRFSEGEESRARSQCYSWRKATMGSTRIARLEGM